MKRLILWASIACFANTVLAAGSGVPISNPESNAEIKLEGFFGFQAGYSNQRNLITTDKNITDNRKRLGFYSDAAFFATVSQNYNDVVAGAKIVLQPTSKAKTSVSYNGSHLFLETEYGKVEVGSPHEATAKMRVTGYNIAAATGTSWNKYANHAGKNMLHNGVKTEFDSDNNFYIDSFVNKFDQINDKTEPARRVSYYTPKLQGFVFGISYTPDTANTGGNRDLKNLDVKTGESKSKTGITTVEFSTTGETIIVNQNVKDAVSAALSYEHEIADDIALKVAVTGEYGKPARSIVVKEKVQDKDKVKAQYKLSDLKAYNLGAVLTYGNFACAASYGSLGKSLTAKEYHKVGRNTHFYNGSVAYTQGPVKTSISYFKSSRYKNTIDAVTLGTEYKITPGVLPYAEVAYFQAKGKPAYYPEALKNKTRGTVAILGAKLKF